uniref:Uncharacterized protein n=1 Tax=Utricularia reniformis TaxID=192314 RepID=A0A1Y0B1J3_9LAMI|nr:hypothetical protein AEK19_MT1026 [Utricularia reniformis]ART31248.1 hypothetical protein AEK19_MT1026 [Utricularia reniformis]
MSPGDGVALLKEGILSKKVSDGGTGKKVRDHILTLDTKPPRFCVSSPKPANTPITHVHQLTDERTGTWRKG